MIVYLETTDTDTIILGTTWLQQFEFYGANGIISI